MLRRLSAVAAILVLFACAPVEPQLPAAPVPAGSGVAVQVEPVPLDPADPLRTHLGSFAYAGGLALTSNQTSRFHGLSDLKLAPDGGLIAISDEGDLVRGRLTLDILDRLSGVSDVQLSPLLDGNGLPLQGKRLADAEGLARLPNGDLLVSFERDHRIWLYPAGGGPPRTVPRPPGDFPENDGMEALAALPALGPDAYLVGVESETRSWVCRLSSDCKEVGRLPAPDGFSVVAVAPLDGGRIAWLFRHWGPLTGSDIILVIVDTSGVELDRMRLARPLTVDNFEGLAATAGPKGTTRFYLLSDDNFSPAQRTLLLAFDWTPKP
jgi:hypothetical protein